MPKCARGAGRSVCGDATTVTACARYSSTVCSTCPAPSSPPITNTRDCTPRMAVAAPWFRRGVRPATLNALHVPGPAGSAWNRCTTFVALTDGDTSEPTLPDTTWISCSGSAVLTPPATVMPNSATAVGRDATVRQVSDP